MSVTKKSGAFYVIYPENSGQEKDIQRKYNRHYDKEKKESNLLELEEK